MSHVDPVIHGTNSLQPMCISRLLEHAAACTPDALAILAPGRLPLTYGRLYRQSHEAVQRLNAMGVGRNDRVALVLPNGPETAVAFLAVASGMTCAPLNPAYSADEFDFYFVDLQVRALVVLAEMDSPARAIAQARGIPIIELSPMLEAEAGLFTLIGTERTCAVSPGFAQPDDVALVLHTSGTTSRPKIVPLTQMNICTSAQELRVFLVVSQIC